MKKSLRFWMIICSVCFLLVVGAVYYWKYEKAATENHQTVTTNKKHLLDDKEINNRLPLKARVEAYDDKRETIAYRLFFDLMDDFKTSGLLASASFTRFQLLDGDEEAFNVAVVFQVQLGEGVQHTSWGDEQTDGSVEGLVWKLKIKKNADRLYTLEGIEKLTDTMVGLPPVEDEDTYKKEAGIEDSNENNHYEIMNDTLKITYNNGKDWVNVPTSLDALFEGDYSGPKNQLIEGSYVILPKRTAFVIGGHKGLRLLQTMDQGSSWDEIMITNQISGVRMRLLGFTSDLDGYLIMTGDRTMSSEANVVLKTKDGGQSWEIVGGVKDTNRLVTDGGFINDKLGFMSFGALNVMDQPPRPSLYRTVDGGSNWEEIEVPIPDEYKGIFTVAEIPTFKGSQGNLVVNQGPDGDYLGGNVRAKFTSKDEGKTWTFSSLIDPDHVLGK